MHTIYKTPRLGRVQRRSGGGDDGGTGERCCRYTTGGPGVGTGLPTTLTGKTAVNCRAWRDVNVVGIIRGENIIYTRVLYERPETGWEALRAVLHRRRRHLVS